MSALNSDSSPETALSEVGPGDKVRDEFHRERFRHRLRLLRRDPCLRQAFWRNAGFRISRPSCESLLVSRCFASCRASAGVRNG